MARQASAAAAQAGHDSDLRKRPDPASAQATPARPRPARPPAPARAPGPLTPPGPGRPPSTRHPSAEPGRYASAELRPDPAAPARARRLTRDCLARWDLPALTDDAEAIASEIVTNAVNAVPPGTTGLTIIYAIHSTPAELLIHTWDIGPGKPEQTHPGPDAEHGRGLAIVDDLTGHNWGWWPTPASGGKVTWAALPTATEDDTRNRPC
jgi:hypothetical protein